MSICRREFSIIDFDRSPKKSRSLADTRAVPRPFQLAPGRHDSIKVGYQRLHARFKD